MWRRKQPPVDPDRAASVALAGRTQSAERLLRGLEWTVLRRLDGWLEGDYRTLFRGLGLDLADLRQYQYQDDVRHIDWNVTARMDEPYVRQFHQDREATAWFLLDLSPSVDFGSGERRKRDVLIDAVAVFGRLVGSHGNRVGAIFYGRQVDAVLPARAGRQHLLQLLHRLHARPPADDTRGGGTDLAALLRRADAVIRRRSMVFVISDFICPTDWTQAMGQLAQRHDVLAIRLLDPLERELPDVGLMVMQDAETGEQLLVDTHAAGFRRRFEAAAAARDEQLRIAFGDAGVDALELSTDEDMLRAVRRFVELRRTRLRLASGGGAVHLSGVSAGASEAAVPAQQ
ncbi:MAG TPA: DUF58 domain-containing protein [Burkholderiaceae bacterium]|nr:DUF58 domain-containing protein [Burkholderiaceae bacterium]